MGERARNSRRTSANTGATTPVKTHTRDQERFAARQRTFCKNAIKEMLSDDNSVNFSRPVGELWDLDELPDYKEKVKRPMDLGTVQNVLEARGFLNEKTELFDPELFCADVRLTFENALAYNEVGTDMHGIAKRFLGWFEDYMRDLPTTPTLFTPVSAAPSPAPLDPAAATSPPEAPPTPDIPAPVEDAHSVSAELESLHAERAQLASQLDDRIGAMPSLEMTDEERVRLRDEVEQLPWEQCKRVVDILQTHVDAALSSVEEPRPEFVDIDLNIVEPKLLFEIQEYLHPSSDPKRTKLLQKIADIDARIASVDATFPGGARSSGKKRDRGRDRRDREKKRRRK
jgi:Bromodomain/Bromodomain extra-terminal - transcription regulation